MCHRGPFQDPCCFFIYINDISENFSDKVFTLLYADDSKIAVKIKSFDDCYLLQDHSYKLERWSSKWGMEFNSGKCKVMHFSRKNTCIKFNYTLNEDVLENVTIFNDLGLLVTCNLSWNPCRLGLIKRTLAFVVNRDVKKICNCAMVRPELRVLYSIMVSL